MALEMKDVPEDSKKNRKTDITDKSLLFTK